MDHELLRQIEHARQRLALIEAAIARELQRARERRRLKLLLFLHREKYAYGLVLEALLTVARHAGLGVAV
jgi:hypothetical protein